jgi:hypothetical protein
VFPEPGRIPEQLQYEVGPKDVATLPTGYHGHVVPGHALSESRHTWRPYDLISVGFVRDVPTPLARTEYVTANDNLWRQHVYFVPEFTSIMLEPLTYYQGGQRTERSWWKQPALPSVVESAGLGTGLPVLRDQDVLVVQLAEWGDADPGHWGWKVPGIDTTPFRLVRDGQLVAQAGQPLGSFPLSAEPATYRMELEVRRSAPWWRLSTRTATAWTFPSQRPPGGGQEILPLLLVDYDLHLDLLNRAPLPQEGGGANVLAFAVRHQLGAAGGEPIGGLRLWVSYDDGTTWKQKQVRSRGGGRFQAVLDQRDVEETSGFVSLKVEAWDRGGSRIEQETIRAYALKPRDG